MITSREAVRMSLMRETLHLVTARDALALRPPLRPLLERPLSSGNLWGRQLVGVELEAVAAAGRSLLEEEPRSSAALGAALRERWPRVDAAALATAARFLVPTVQIPPRGVWGASGQAVWATVRDWLGREPERRRPARRPRPALPRGVRPRHRARRAGVVRSHGRQGDPRSAEARAPHVPRRARARALRRARTARCPTPTRRRRRGSCPSSTTSSSRTMTAAASSPTSTGSASCAISAA